ncbi:hypothetical protein BDQ12DRAFT_349868 [Crucibulum laeve]|uniref:Uncharacterized protein n=1 Tax=Crucibulum laeve TaxID=68775 RepID=A0A5C3M9Q6_9AGAR|nr:hypothetical protein BDQ12DRAFT_349868 [Crucibulum laeve]
MAEKGEAPTSSTNAPASRLLPTHKLIALARLKSFTGSFVPKRPEPVVFPPPSWELDDTKDNGAGASSWADQFHEDQRSKEAAASAPPVDTNPLPVEEPPEPVTFAKRLRTLIELLPLPGTSTPTTTHPKPPSAPDDGKQGSPIPPGMDPGLVRMLSSEDVMNGDEGVSTIGKARQSVWNILAGLGHGGRERASGPATVEEQEQGVMMYAPLQPTNDSEVELAESETILEYVDEKPTEFPDGMDKGKQQPDPASGETQPTREKHVWVPSTTQISLLTTWWGYRLYLPPPVMEILDGTSLKATARAAMITSALKWLLDKIPLMIVPPQLRAAVTLLKRLSPVVGYVGVFVAWSWGRVRACDKGNGVVLTATWLLPVAVVPMAWDAGDINGPSLPPKFDEKATKPDDKGIKKEGKKKSRYSLW